MHITQFLGDESLRDQLLAWIVWDSRELIPLASAYWRLHNTLAPSLWSIRIDFERFQQELTDQHRAWQQEQQPVRGITLFLEHGLTLGDISEEFIQRHPERLACQLVLRLRHWQH